MTVDGKRHRACPLSWGISWLDSGLLPCRPQLFLSSFPVPAGARETELPAVAGLFPRAGKGLEAGTSHSPIREKVGVEQSWLPFQPGGWAQPSRDKQGAPLSKGNREENIPNTKIKRKHSINQMNTLEHQLPQGWAAERLEKQSGAVTVSLPSLQALVDGSAPQASLSEGCQWK